MKHILCIALTILVSGCASTFKPIDKTMMAFQKAQASTGIEFAYRKDVLAESQNEKYDQKAQIADLDIVAIRLKNITDKAVKVGEDLEFLAGDAVVVSSNPKRAAQVTRQRTGLYFLYLLMSPVIIYKQDVKCNAYDCSEDTSFFPIGLILGLLLTALNAGISSSANSAFEKEFVDNDLTGKIVQPGQEVVGYLVFRNLGSSRLSARLTHSNLSSTSPAGHPSQVVPLSNP